MQHYDTLARIFHYPDADFQAHVARVQAFLDTCYPEAAICFQPFTEVVCTIPIEALEELYTRSFEVQAITTLDLGYVLFGDDYKRGQLLVHLNREHQEAGNDCGGELSDHLPNILRLLSRMGDTALRDELVEKIVLPALARIIKEFDPEIIQRKSKVYEKHHRTVIERSLMYGTLYQHPLTAVLLVLAKDFGVSMEKLPDISKAFFKNVETEMELM